MAAGFSMPSSGTDTVVDVLADLEASFEDLYEVIIKNDDVTTFSTVITAVVRLFDQSPEEAEDLAMRVHTAGQAVAAILPKDEAEKGVAGLHEFLITAIMKKV